MARQDAALKTVMVTGGNSGLGLACARSLAAAGGWHVVIAARDEKKSAAAARYIVRTVPEARVETLRLDLGSLAGVRETASRWADIDRPPLHALVCNAGVQLAHLGARTADGLEMTFGVNHLGHFELVNRLLPQFIAPGRIVIVSSSTHDPTRRTGMPPPRLESVAMMAHPQSDPRLDADPTLAARRAYATSKLCNLLFAQALARRLGGRDITVNSFDPGFMPGTGLSRNMGPVAHVLFRYLLGPLSAVVPGLATPESAGRALARLVTDPALAGVSGRYFNRNGEDMLSVDARDGQKAELLWEQSGALLQTLTQSMPPLVEVRIGRA